MNGAVAGILRHRNHRELHDMEQRDVAYGKRQRSPPARPPGLRNLTVTNPDTGVGTGNNVFTVN